MDVRFNYDALAQGLTLGEYIKVKHGKWMPVDPDTRGCTLRFACSVCDNFTTYYENAHKCDYDYCPNCGAKMDLEE